jgi:LEA14-like dessication related protein
MSKKTNLIIIGSILAVGIAVYLHIRRQVNLLYNFCYKFKRLKFNKVTAKDIEFDIIMQFENKSSIDFTINSYDFALYVNDKYLGQISKKNINQYIQAKGWSDLIIGIQFDPREAIKNAITIDNLLNVVLNKKDIKIRLDGIFSASHAGLLNVKDFPFTLEMTLDELTSSPDNNTSVCP